MSDLFDSKEYNELLAEIKNKILSAQLRASLAVNREVINLYWQVGQHILEKQKTAAWGDKLLSTLSQDLRKHFPEVKGFSLTNLKYMRLLAMLYPSGIGQQSVDQLPWGHVTILIRIKDEQERHWYLQESIAHGWPRHRLEEYVKSNLYARQVLPENKASNYLARLPEPQSQLAQEILKSPYNFDFLGLHRDAYEREVEHTATQHITHFLMELGKGFAFLGTQVPLELEENEYFVDMLFYHVKLHCYVVIEIKATAFKPEHAGQLNFYLNLVDDKIKSEDDNPTIGILLCKSRNKLIAEYALKGIDKPIGVSEYQLTKAIPENMKTSLPSVEELEKELGLLSDAAIKELGGSEQC